MRFLPHRRRIGYACMESRRPGRQHGDRRSRKEHFSDASHEGTHDYADYAGPEQSVSLPLERRLTMRGLNNLFPYHWRGDEPNFAAFNSAFDSLMGGPVLSNTDMAAFTAYIKI